MEMKEHCLSAAFGEKKLPILTLVPRKTILPNPNRNLILDMNDSFKILLDNALIIEDRNKSLIIQKIF